MSVELFVIAACTAAWAWLNLARASEPTPPSSIHDSAEPLRDVGL